MAIKVSEMVEATGVGMEDLLMVVQADRGVKTSKKLPVSTFLDSLDTIRIVEVPAPPVGSDDVHLKMGEGSSVVLSGKRTVPNPMEEYPIALFGSGQFNNLLVLPGVSKIVWGGKLDIPFKYLGDTRPLKLKATMSSENDSVEVAPNIVLANDGISGWIRCVSKMYNSSIDYMFSGKVTVKDTVDTNIAYTFPLQTSGKCSMNPIKFVSKVYNQATNDIVFTVQIPCTDVVFRNGTNVNTNVKFVGLIPKIYISNVVGGARVMCSDLDTMGQCFKESTKVQYETNTNPTVFSIDVSKLTLVAGKTWDDVELLLVDEAGQLPFLYTGEVQNQVDMPVYKSDAGVGFVRPPALDGFALTPTTYLIQPPVIGGTLRVPFKFIGSNLSQSITCYSEASYTQTTLGGYDSSTGNGWVEIKTLRTHTTTSWARIEFPEALPVQWSLAGYSGATMVDWTNYMDWTTLVYDKQEDTLSVKLLSKLTSSGRAVSPYLNIDGWVGTYTVAAEDVSPNLYPDTIEPLLMRCWRDAPRVVFKLSDKLDNGTHKITIGCQFLNTYSTYNFNAV